MNDKNKISNRRQSFVIGIGGTTRPDSSSEQALRMALDRLAGRGFQTALFSGDALMLPMYDPSTKQLSTRSRDMIDAVQRADGVVIASPCYHGSVSGLLKNALDYLEETSKDNSPYFHGKVVGLIGCGFGSQGPAMVLSQLRTITHALRGWPVPMGVVINTATTRFAGGSCSDPNVGVQLAIMADQIAEFIGRSSVRSASVA